MSAPYRVRTIEFGEDRSAHAIFVKASTSPRYILTELDPDPLPRGIITVSGGAGNFPVDIVEQTKRIIQTVIVPLTLEYDLLVVDGGTASGVVKLIGEAFAEQRTADSSVRPTEADRTGHFLMGFVPASKITYPGFKRARQSYTPLEPNHFSFVLVIDAKEWGGEVKTLYKFLDYLSTHRHIPIVNLVVNGGRITIKEVYYATRQGWPVIVLDGSKRATEVMVAAAGGASQRTLIELLEQRGLTRNTRDRRETLRWLQRIGQYDQLTRFPFLSGRPEDLRQTILSRLGLTPA